MNEADPPATPVSHFDPGYPQRLWHDGAVWLSNNALSILIAVAAAAIIVGLLISIRSLGVRLCRYDRLENGWPAIIGRVISRTRLWFMVALAAELVAGYTSPPPAIAHSVQLALTIATALQAALWVRELVVGFIDHRTGSDPDHQMLGSAKGLIHLLVTIALFAIAIVLILDNVGVNVTGLVAGLGIGGIAIGLAAQGIFSDLFAALSIIFDKPFRLGDTVSWDQTTGTVERIGLKTTRIRSLNGEQVIVSNANLLNKELHNLSHQGHRRFIVKFGLIYQTPPERCAEITSLLKTIVERQKDCAFVRAVMTGFGASSLDFELIYDVRRNNPNEAAHIHNEICVDILRSFREAGVEFAYPTQTTFTAAPNGSMIMPYATAKT
jgi:small-conductance mechanosensitive channel